MSWWQKCFLTCLCASTLLFLTIFFNPVAKIGFVETLQNWTLTLLKIAMWFLITFRIKSPSILCPIEPCMHKPLATSSIILPYAHSVVVTLIQPFMDTAKCVFMSALYTLWLLCSPRAVFPEKSQGCFYCCWRPQIRSHLQEVFLGHTMIAYLGNSFRSFPPI